MNVLVTGGCGFVGSHLTERLVKEGFKVRVLGLTCNLENIHGLVDSKDVEFVRGDLSDASTCKKAVEGCDIVSHLAAQISIDKSIIDPERFFETNVGGTFRILEAAREAHVKKFHYMSTCEVLGLIDAPLKADENWPHPVPRSPYAASKFTAEAYCRSYNITFGLPVTITRSFNIFGPRQNPGSAGALIAKVSTKVLNGQSPEIYGDGKQTRDWTYVEDIVDGIYRCITTDGTEGELFHLASGVDREVGDVIQQIIKLCGREGKISPTRIAARLGELRRSVGNASKAKRVLKWEPRTDFETGLRKTVEFYKSRMEERGRPSRE